MVDIWQIKVKVFPKRIKLLVSYVYLIDGRKVETVFLQGLKDLVLALLHIYTNIARLDRGFLLTGKVAGLRAALTLRSNSNWTSIKMMNFHLALFGVENTSPKLKTHANRSHL